MEAGFPTAASTHGSGRLLGLPVGLTVGERVYQGCPYNIAYVATIRCAGKRKQAVR